MPIRLTLAEARRMRGYSQEYMANMLNIHRNTYAVIEKEPENCSIKLARQICDILNIEAQQINFFESISTNCRDK